MCDSFLELFYFLINGDCKANKVDLGLRERTNFILKDFDFFSNLKNLGLFFPKDLPLWKYMSFWFGY